MARFAKNIASVRKRVEAPARRALRGSQAWTDPFPEVHGTLPEKMVYAELTRRGIPFYFLNDVTINIPEISLLKDYQADFVIPGLRLIIEVQGAFWHSKEKTIEGDAYKFALYESMGYRVLAWWDFDIIGRLHDLFIMEPQLLAVTTANDNYRSTELVPLKRTKVDTSKGIRTMNARRYREPAPKVSKRKLRKGLMSYATN